MSEDVFWLLVLIGAIALVIALLWVFRLIMYPRPGPAPDPGEPVVILDGLSELNAEMLRSKLDAAGIMAYVRSGGWFAPTMWYRPLTGWQVLVRYADRFEAEHCLGMTLLTSEASEALEDAPS